jgi:aminoglycoside 6'-N-acetyltransferase
MHITFESLQSHHLPLLIKWLKIPHVKAFWDQDVSWTLELIQEKYGLYIDGYKLEQGAKKAIYAYVILVDGLEVGYIQYYNAYDFPRNELLNDLPENLAAFDIFIGEEDYVGKGIGPMAIELFCNQYIFKEFDYCLSDPDMANLRAIKAYKKAGFVEVESTEDGKVVIMIKTQKH